MVGGADDNDVGEVVRCGILRQAGVNVSAIVAGRGDEEDVPLGIDGIVERLGIPSAPPAVVGGDDIGTGILQFLYILKALNRRIGGAGPSRIQKLAGRQLHLPVDPCDTRTVISCCTDCPGHMGTVPVVVEGV